jgi:hypothetical protein
MFPVMAMLIQRTLVFPNVPYELGCRLLHTPENFQLALAGPKFEITRTSPPHFNAGYAQANFEFDTYFGPGRARLFTNNVTRTNLMLWHENEPYHYLFASFKVMPKEDGCMLLMSADLNKFEKSFLIGACLEHLNLDRIFKRRMHIWHEDPNIGEYRELLTPLIKV